MPVSKKRPTKKKNQKKPSGSARLFLPVRPSDFTEPQSRLFKLFADQVEGDRKNGTTTGRAWLEEVTTAALISLGTVTLGDHGKFSSTDIRRVADLFGVEGDKNDPRIYKGYTMITSSSTGQTYSNIQEAVEATAEEELD